MLIFKKVADLRHWLDRQNLPIGFAPTMGALHAGHLELIRMAKNDGCLAVASIFVNPTQFNDPKDLDKYPRTPEKDAELLIGAGCDVLFMPPVDEVYPPGQDLTIDLDFGLLDKVMEGEFRPGHFKGMATVVNRLLDIVKPQKLYMGQKDYQQLSIVRDMIRQLTLPVELIMCPTVREPDGLAMSSRNVRLSPEMRAAAPVIHQTLQWAKTALEADLPRDEIQAQAMDKLRAAGLRPEYFELVDGFSLAPIRPKGAIAFMNETSMGDGIVACTAAFAGEVRLIDNLVLVAGR
ncbi:MAG TPA: pantoate--beta-alanine ligase [Saprospirales bacterium]|nr:pantoate--beta-alanine ligase [Saprospirales bacterium]